MKWHIFLAVFVLGTMSWHVEGAAASGSAEDFYSTIAQMNEVRKTNLQAKYSRQLRQSINAAAIRHLEHNCGQQHPGARVQTFTLLGLMRLDGVFKTPSPLPENSFTRCVAGKMNLVTFPLPPGSGRGWPIAIQFDGSSGKVLYVAGDKQSALPHYSGQVSTTAVPWVYTPVPIVPEELQSDCTINVWVSVEEAGHVSEADVADSNCPEKFGKAVQTAAGQWLYMGAPGAKKVEQRDVRVSFKFRNRRLRVSF